MARHQALMRLAARRRVLVRGAARHPASLGAAAQRRVKEQAQAWRRIAVRRRKRTQRQVSAQLAARRVVRMVVAALGAPTRRALVELLLLARDESAAVWWIRVCVCGLWSGGAATVRSTSSFVSPLRCRLHRSVGCSW